MNRQAIIERTIKAINQLPEEKAGEIGAFADFISKRYEEEFLTQGLRRLTEKGRSFDFLKDEEDLCTDADLKEVYHG